MIIIQMAGGLGNQMFQYALYKQLSLMGKTVKMDDEMGFREDRQRNPELSFFGIHYEKASPEEIMRMRDSSPAVTAKVRRKLFGRRKKAYFEESKRFQEKIFGWDDIYLEGYWQSEKYFPDAADGLKKEYSLDNIRKCQDSGGLSRQAEEMLQRITQTQSVSVHIRRGDYLLPQNQALFGGICTETYYVQAMKRIADEYQECIFYLFTNDRTWGKEWIQKMTDEGKQFPVVLAECPQENDCEELVLMSRCKHNILANSSFSWWASYLNPNPEKTVIAPKQWLNGWDCTDIYRADMIKL